MAKNKSEETQETQATEATEATPKLPCLTNAVTNATIYVKSDSVSALWSEAPAITGVIVGGQSLLVVGTLEEVTTALGL